MRNIWCILRCPQLPTGATDKSDAGAVQRFFALPFGRKVNLFWQIFTLGYRDCDNSETSRGLAQFADPLSK